MTASGARPDVLLIGGGLIGLAVAYRLAERGRSVTVLEAAPRLLGGASLATYAWTNAVGKSPRAYFDLNVAGMREHQAIVEELGGGEWLHRGGDIQLATGAAADALAEKVDQMREWGYAAEWIDRTALAELEPDVVCPPDARIARFPDDCWVDPVALGARVAGAARDRGVTVRTGVRVEAMRRDGDRVLGVVASDGATYEAETVVSCAGAASGEIAALVGATIPMKGSHGLLVVTEPAPASVHGMVHAPGVYFRPDGAGRLMVAADGIDKDLRVNGGDLEPIEAAERVLAAASAVVPALSGVRAEAARVGRRALTADGLPAIGHLPGTRNLYLVVTHSGITLGPLIGRLVADELVGARPEHDLAPYRPDRFASVAPAAS